VKYRWSSRRRSNPNAETFSLHPRHVNEYDDNMGMVLGTVVTTGAFIGYNDAFAQQSFEYGRSVIADRGLNAVFDRVAVEE
jgi:hypothetical protein